MNNVLQFLTELFDSYLGYSGINTAKSALSSVVTLSDSDSRIGKHQLIKRFMRGVFNLRPSVGRYTETFDAAQVLNYLRQIDIEEISLRQITLKTTMLIALLSGQRVQTLRALRIHNVKHYDNKVEFYIDSLLKKSKPGKHLPTLCFNKYPVENICVVRHVRKYIDMTKKIGNDDSFFISFQKPHKNVSTETISRWIRLALKQSGVDTEKFKAHSTRSASASAALSQGVPVDIIMGRVGWSSERTFAKFYNKSVDSDT